MREIGNSHYNCRTILHGGSMKKLIFYTIALLFSATSLINGLHELYISFESNDRLCLSATNNRGLFINGEVGQNHLSITAQRNPGPITFSAHILVDNESYDTSDEPTHALTYNTLPGDYSQQFTINEIHGNILVINSDGQERICYVTNNPMSIEIEITISTDSNNFISIKAWQSTITGRYLLTRTTDNATHANATNSQACLIQ